MQAPRDILGEHYRLVRDHYNLPPYVIMHQADTWGPYDPIISPQGMALSAWENRSYEYLLVNMLNSLPPTMQRAPRPELRSTALRIASGNKHERSLTHEYHKADEMQDMQAVAGFLACHPPINIFMANVPAYQIPGQDWRNTEIFQSKYGPVNNVAPRWMAMDTQGHGVAGVGHVGVSHSAAQHRAQNLGNVVYQNVSANDAETGKFNIMGTPRR
jgi:hypothetical protein